MFRKLLRKIPKTRNAAPEPQNAHLPRLCRRLCIWIWARSSELLAWLGSCSCSCCWSCSSSRNMQLQLICGLLLLLLPLLLGLQDCFCVVLRLQRFAYFAAKKLCVRRGECISNSCWPHTWQIPGCFMAANICCHSKYLTAVERSMQQGGITWWLMAAFNASASRVFPSLSQLVSIRYAVCQRRFQVT